MSGGDKGNSNKSNIIGTALTFGIGAVVGAAAYYFLSDEPQAHTSRASSSRSSSSSSSRTSGQNSEWRKNDSGRNQPDTCSICLENIPSRSARVLLGCGHEFHSTCIEPWLERHANCPVCRQGVE